MKLFHCKHNPTRKVTTVVRLAPGSGHSFAWSMTSSPDGVEDEQER